jgi:high frequency lysogenization protein
MNEVTDTNTTEENANTKLVTARDLAFYEGCDITHFRALAFSALYQSVTLIDELASEGKTPDKYLDPLVNAVLVLDANEVQEIFPKIDELEMGIVELGQMFKLKSNSPRQKLINSYAMRVIYLETLLSKNKVVQQKLTTELNALKAQENYLRTYEDEDKLLSKLNDIYINTIGQFSYRIQIMGSKDHLQKDEVSNRIRALLLAGVRACHLWRHYGGTKWNLLINFMQYSKALDQLKDHIQ